MSTPIFLDSFRQGVASKLDQTVPDDKIFNLEVIHTDENDSNFQEGGLRGWLTVLGAFLVQFCGFGYLDAYGVYQDYYTRIYITNQPASAIAWIGSVNAFLITVGGLFSGILYDRGYFYHLLYGGSFLTSFSLFMLSLTKPNHLYQNLLAQGIGLGLAGGMMYIPSVAVLSLYFRKNRALAMTFASSGSFFGAVVHPLMLSNLFPSRLGFGGTTRASAGMVTVALLIACMLMRPQLPPPIKRPSIVNLVRKFYKDWPYMAMSVGILFYTVGFYFPLFYLQLDATQHGISKSLAFNMLVVMNASSLLGSLSPGFFAHSLGVVNMLVTACFCCTILIFAMVGLTNIPSFVAIAVLYGYFVGIYITLLAPVISFLTIDVSEFGSCMGMIFTFNAIGALIGPPIHGSLLSTDFIWWRPAVVSGMFALIGTSLFAALPFFMKKRKMLK